MNNMMSAKYTIPALILAFGGGLTYWVMSNRDTTPVGLTIVKQINDVGGHIGQDEEENNYEISLVTGTWRANESSLPVVSINEDTPILVVFKNGEPINGEIVKLDEWKPPTEFDDEDQAYKFFLNQQKQQVKLMKEYGIDTSAIEKSIEMQENNTVEAESIFGPMTTLQSHFVW